MKLPQCSFIMCPRKGPNKGHHVQCALREGHAGPHRSVPVKHPVGIETREGKRGEQKRQWDRANAWRYKDKCPGCGGVKSQTAKVCLSCTRTTH